MARCLCLCLLVLMLAVRPAVGDALTLLVENDSFFSPSDRDYTNGVELDLTRMHSRDWATRLAGRLLPGEGNVSTSYGLGQLLFTPATLSAVNPPAGEHPYAGYLYGRFALSMAGSRGFSSLGVELGVTGPPALGEQSQKIIHAIEGLPKPLGWGHQLHTEAAFDVHYDQGWRWRLLPYLDVTPQAGLTLGTLHDYAHAGATFRVGRALPGISLPGRISADFAGTGFARAAGAYLFLGADARGVAHNLFLDGNSFRASGHVAHEAFVGEIEAGGAAMLGPMQLTVTHIWRTREFSGQPVGDQLSTIALTVRL